MTSPRQNILFIISDDHGREAFGAYGNKVVKTPNLDMLAREGVLFDYAFCTTASCGASRSVLNTGLHNHTNRTFGHVHQPHNFSMGDHIKTLPAYLKEAGYRTGRIGKKHYRPESLFPFDWNPADPADEVLMRDDIAMANDCRAFIDADPETPFYLYYCSHNPHRLKLKEDHPLKPDNFGNPPHAFPGDTEEYFSPDDVVVPYFLKDTPGTRAELAEYYQSIARLDRGIGRLIWHLKDAGVYDNTFIVYLSDNGGAFPVAKTTLYDPGSRLPLIVRDPSRKKKGFLSKALVNWTDITPTLADVAGRPIDLTAPFLGKSLLPILEQEDPQDWRDELFAAHSFHQITNYYPMRSIRTRTHKFIYNIAHRLDFPSAADLWRSATWQSARSSGDTIGDRKIKDYLLRPIFELYDLVNDPHELHNLADQPEYASMLDDFKKRTRDYQVRTQDPWLHKWEYE